MPLFARRYSPNTSTRRVHGPDDHPTFVPMSKTPGPANIRPQDLPEEPPEGSSEDGDVVEG